MKLWITVLLACLVFPSLRSINPVASGATQKQATDTGTQADFYVSPKGRDSWSGTLAAPNQGASDGPFATMEKAKEAAAQMARQRKKPVLVVLRGGTYFQAKPLTFSRQDSGSAAVPIVYQNYPIETPVISGGMKVTNWKNAGGNKWQTTLPASTQYFEQLFYNGQRRLRPRLGGYLGKYYRVQFPVLLPDSGDPNCPTDVRPLIQRMARTRGPNSPYGRALERFRNGAFDCFDRFRYAPNEPISADWANLKPPYPEGDIELYNFEHWTTPKLRIKSIDTREHIIYLTGPTLKDPRFYGFLPQHRYVIENVKDEFKEPGQWFLDRSSSPWTLSYLARSGEDPNRDTVIVPQAPQVMVADGLQYVTFKGITFAHDNWTVPAAGYQSKQEEPNLPAAVSCQNCQHVVFDGSTVTQTAGTGIEFVTTDPAKTTADDSFQNGAIYDVGGMAVRVGRYNNPDVDTDANVPHNVRVENTAITGFSRVMPSSVGIVQGAGHDNLYTHNDIFDGYHSAVSICAPACPPGRHDSHGDFNNVVSFNHAWNLFKGLLGDGGCLYFATGGARWNPTGNTLLNNKCHDVNDDSLLDADGGGGHGLYLDEQTGNVDVENNLVYRVSGIAMFLSKGVAQQGWANNIKNNIFAFARQGMVSTGSPTAWLQGCPSSPILMFNLTNNILVFDRDKSSSGNGFDVQRGCAYSCGFPYNEFQNWRGNIFWHMNGGFHNDPKAFHYTANAPADPKASCGGPQDWQYVKFDQWQNDSKLREDAGSLIKNPPFRNVSEDDFGLSGSPGTGFVPFDINAPGRTHPVIKPPEVDDTFPTAAYKRSDF